MQQEQNFGVKFFKVIRQHKITNYCNNEKEGTSSYTDRSSIGAIQNEILSKQKFMTTEPL